MRHPGVAAERVVAIVALVLVTLGLWPAVVLADTLPFADPAFQNVWQQADGPVASGAAQRSWLWGPTPIGVSRDHYVESTAPGGLRLVQFFDKSRMEITRPDGDPASIWYVTNGLLVKELVSGLVQYGDNRFQDSGLGWWGPVAGDPDSIKTPGYADFEAVATLDGTSNRREDRTGLIVGQWMAANGAVTDGQTPEAVTLASYESTLGHNIPSVFWNWMNDAANGITTYGSWVYPMGYPITEPYWVTATIGGVEHAILVQLFERRVLTYTPDNAPAWRVEMGNVGQAYMRRYASARNDSAEWSPDGQRVAFLSQRVGNYDLYTINADGSALTQLTDTAYDEYDPHWQPNGAVVSYQTFFPDLNTWGYRQAFIDGSQDRPYIVGYTGPVVSPDGTKFTYHYYPGDGSEELRVVDFGATSGYVIANVTGGAYFGCTKWSPDGRRIAYCVNSPGTNPTLSLHVVDLDGSNHHELAGSWSDTWVSEISWAADSQRLTATRLYTDGRSDLYLAQADGSGMTPLVISDGVQPDYAANPAWSPIGDEIVFVGGDPTHRDGLWSIDADGSNLHKITTSVYFSPKWSPDGSRLLTSFNGALWILNADGSGPRLLDVPPQL
jgi:Tol biopolymer transport system component